MTTSRALNSRDDIYKPVMVFLWQNLYLGIIDLLNILERVEAKKNFLHVRGNDESEN